MTSIVEQHAVEAAVLWELREAAAQEPHFDLSDLARADERVEANLDGLRLAGATGWEACKANLGEKSVGETFAAAAIAIHRHDAKGIAHVLDRAGESAALFRGIEGAFAWSSWEPMEPFVSALLDPRCPPELHRLGLVACAAHGRDPGVRLDEALHSSDAALVARALFAAGELGRASAAVARRDALESRDPEQRFAAAWTLARTNDAAAIEALTHVATEGGLHARAAADLSLRLVDPRRARAIVGDVARRSTRAGIVAARATGLPDLVPWLLECMTSDDLARVAGESISIVLGLDLSTSKLRRKPPEGFKAGPNDDPDDGDVARDPDENLPWPDVAKVRSAWQRSQKKYAPGVRHLLGEPTSPDVARRALRSSTQRARAAAALDLAVVRADSPLFDVRAPAHHQRRRLTEIGA